MLTLRPAFSGLELLCDTNEEGMVEQWMAGFATSFVA